MGLIALGFIVPFTFTERGSFGLVEGRESASQKTSRPVMPQERQVARLDAMQESLDRLEQAMRAGSVDAQQEQITALRQQLAEMRADLSNGGDRPPRPRGDEPSR